MKKILGNWKALLMPCLALIATFGIIHHNGIRNVSANDKRSTNRLLSNNPQTLPFSQNWTNIGLITANDDWIGVPGITGYRGDDLTMVTGTDPRTILVNGSGTPVDVNANQSNPDTFITGGVAEFEITNPVIALNGSGTADAPHIVVHLNTTGQSNINFQCNLRDLDASADDAAMQVDVQLRVGGAGDYMSVAGGYFADVTTGGTATQVTPVNVTLPGTANNQASVAIRVMTTNAVGNDEWVGIDDISVTGSPGVTADAPVDFNGDGKTDYAVYRNVGGPGQLRWFYNTNGTGDPTVALDWGLQGDLLLMEDFDGDGKDDITAYRQALAFNSAFYILQSLTNTVRIEPFGLIGDDASVVGDYDGDGKADVAVYRAGATPGLQSTWIYIGSLTPSTIRFVPWGVNGDKVAPGDYDGDGKNDFVIARDEGGSLRFWQRFATGTMTTQVFGITGDAIIPGDYDGDAKTDLAVLRNPGIGVLSWYIQPSTGGNYQHFQFGMAFPLDSTAQGDYDGDGKCDIAIWRASTGQFWSRNSGNGASQVFTLGSSNDQAIAFFNKH